MLLLAFIHRSQRDHIAVIIVVIVVATLVIALTLLTTFGLLVFRNNIALGEGLERLARQDGRRRVVCMPPCVVPSGLACSWGSHTRGKPKVEANPFSPSFFSSWTIFRSCSRLCRLKE